jgi:hypothetical protein
MKIVKTLKPNSYWGHGLHIDVPYIQPHMYIDAQPELLEIKLYTPANEIIPERILLWQKIDLASLNTLNGFVDQTLWTTQETDDFTEVDGVQSFIQIHPAQMVDILSKTLSSKSIHTNDTSGYNKTPYVIYVPDSNGNFDDFTLVLKVNTLNEFIIEGPSASDVTSEVVAGATALIPTVTLSSTQTTVGPDSTISIDVTTDPSVKEVYLEQIYGMLNKTRVPMTNGVGSFQLFTTGLNSGEQAKVKAGFRKFTGTASFSITVS